MPRFSDDARNVKTFSIFFEQFSVLRCPPKKSPPKTEDSLCRDDINVVRLDPRKNRLAFVKLQFLLAIVGK